MSNGPRQRLNLASGMTGADHDNIELFGKQHLDGSIARIFLNCIPFFILTTWLGSTGNSIELAARFIGEEEMKKEISIGARGEAEEVVEFKHTLTAHHAELPPVYSTPDMIRLMETAAFLALQPYCEGDEITVGTAINIEHRAASGVGARIKAEAVLEAFDGRFYTLRVSARDDVQEIGRGTVRRAVVSVGKFLEKMRGK
jgi:fluoroacetyl-CoA thioesterase